MRDVAALPWRTVITLLVVSLALFVIRRAISGHPLVDGTLAVAFPVSAALILAGVALLKRRHGVTTSRASTRVDRH